MTVTLSERRLKYLRTVTEQAGGRQRYWFTTLDQITPQTVLTAPIWHVATQSEPHALLEF